MACETLASSRKCEESRPLCRASHEIVLCRNLVSSETRLEASAPPRDLVLISVSHEVTESWHVIPT